MTTADIKALPFAARVELCRLLLIDLAEDHQFPLRHQVSSMHRLACDLMRLSLRYAANNLIELEALLEFASDPSNKL
jgi:hypothetical protein